MEPFLRLIPTAFRQLSTASILLLLCSALPHFESQEVTVRVYTSDEKVAAAVIVYILKEEQNCSCERTAGKCKLKIVAQKTSAADGTVTFAGLQPTTNYIVCIYPEAISEGRRCKTLNDCSLKAVSKESFTTNKAGGSSIVFSLYDKRATSTKHLAESALIPDLATQVLERSEKEKSESSEKKYFVGLSLGYNLPFARSVIGTNSSNNTTSFKLGSWAQGFAPGAEFAMPTSSGLTLNGSLNYILGTAQKFETTSSGAMSSSTDAISAKLQMPQINLGATYSFPCALLGKIQPYIGTGLMLGILPQIKRIETISSTNAGQTNNVEINSTIKCKNAIGGYGQLGAKYQLNSKWTLFADAKISALALTPKTQTITSQVVNGVDVTSSLSTRDKTINYVNEISSAANSDPGKPREDLADRLPASAITLRTGVYFNIGNDDPKVPKQPQDPSTKGPDTPISTVNDSATPAFGIEITRCDPAWQPKGVAYTQFTATIYKCENNKWVPLGPADKGKVITFELHHTSTEPGHCMNFGKGEEADMYFPKASLEPNGNADAKFSFENGMRGKYACEKKLPRSPGTGEEDNPGHGKANGHWQQAITKQAVTSETIIVRCEDFGGFSWISATAAGCMQMPTREATAAGPNCNPTDPLNRGIKNAAGCCVLDATHDVRINWEGPGSNLNVKNCWAKIPRDDDDNGIPDAVIQNQCGVSFEGGKKDEDAAPVGDGTRGDGLTAYEEYRGFVQHTRGANPLIEHQRTDIGVKDLFVLLRSESEKEFKDEYFEYVEAAELSLHILRRNDLMGAPGDPGRWNDVNNRPSNEINYNRKDYRGLADRGGCAQHCLPMITSDKWSQKVIATIVDQLAKASKNEHNAIDDDVKTKLQRSILSPFGRVFAELPTTATARLLGNPDDITLETDDGTPGSPASVFVVAVNLAKCGRSNVAGDGQRRIRQVIAHELGHGIGMWHHGPQPGAPCAVRINGNLIKFSVMHTVTSGVQNCIMRYDQIADGWFEGNDCTLKNKQHKYPTPERNSSTAFIGSTFCTSKTGTGVNNHNGVTNDADRGECKSQIKVKDW